MGPRHRRPARFGRKWVLALVPHQHPSRYTHVALARKACVAKYNQKTVNETLLEIINAIRAEEAAPDAAARPLDDAWLASVVRRRNREMRDGTRQVAKKRLLPAYLRLRREQPEVLAAWGAPAGSAVDERVIRLLRSKPRRTASGVATITVLTKPWPCAGTCVFCPNDVRMPKSYLADEPACQRAERCSFDPYLQVLARLRVLEDMGHVTDKVELIVLGGTWTDYPRAYQLWFIGELFRALAEAGTPEAEARAAERRRSYEQLGAASPVGAAAAVQRQVDAGSLSYNEAWELLYGSGSAWAQAARAQCGTLAEVQQWQQRDELAAHRCVGLVVETRPEAISPAELTFLRRLGCTKVQVGIQSLDERILAGCGRPVPLSCIERAFALLRLFGFKSHMHMMVNLPGATPEGDAREYRLLMDDARFRPDELKLYPCCLVASSRLGALMESGAWQPYSEDALVELLAADVASTNPYARISRMIRDISATDIVAGNKKTNLRQMVEARLQGAGAPEPPIGEMRLREIGTAEVDARDLHLEVLPYETTVSEERFLQWVDGDGRLAAFLRLSLPKEEALRGLQGACAEDGLPAPGQAMIREVHVYGKVAALHESGEPKGTGQMALCAERGGSACSAPGSSAQGGHFPVPLGYEGAPHAGLGRALVAEACAQSAAAGFTAVNVISAVGTREYYRSLGFEDAGLYQCKQL